MAALCHLVGDISFFADDDGIDIFRDHFFHYGDYLLRLFLGFEGFFTKYLPQCRIADGFYDTSRLSREIAELDEDIFFFLGIENPAIDIFQQ